VDLPEGTEVDARLPPGATIPHAQKTSSATKLMIGKVNGELIIE
jgi:hypothetical protein